MKKGGGIILLIILICGFIVLFASDIMRRSEIRKAERLEQALELVRENYSIDEVFDDSEIHRYASEWFEMVDREDVRWIAEDCENMIDKDDIWYYVNDEYSIDEIYDEKEIRNYIVEKYDLEDIAEWYK